MVNQKEIQRIIQEEVVKVKNIIIKILVSKT